MELSDVSQKLSEGQFSLRDCKGKSDVWIHFGIIINEEKSDLEYVACKKCQTVIKYKGRASGTTNLKRHKCRVSVSQTVLDFPRKTIPITHYKKTNVDIKSAVTESCVNMVTSDLRPFDMISGEGFKSFVQDILKHQYESKELSSVDSILPHPTTVTRQLHLQALVLVYHFLASFTTVNDNDSDSGSCCGYIADDL
jgi:hypothetical protein